MGSDCKQSGGKRRYRRKSKKIIKQSKRNKSKYGKRNHKKRSSRRMKGGGLVDPITSGLHEASNKLVSSAYVPSNTHIQPAGEPYNQDRNPYVV